VTDLPPRPLNAPITVPPTNRRQGVVDSITTLITSGGNTVLAVVLDMGGLAGPVRVLEPYVPVVGDTVELLEVGGDVIVLGRLVGAAVPVPQILTRDGGFPVEGSVTSEQDVIDRYTIAAVSWARRFSAIASVHTSYTQSLIYEILWYRGSTIVGRMERTAAAGVPDALVAIATFDLAADTGATLELRLARVSGTGTVSSSDGLYTSASVIAVPT
jgi:hypothetical protein